MSDDQREFEWDTAKSARNDRERRLPFTAGVEVFYDPRGIVEEDVFAVDEQRFNIIGWGDGRLLTVAFSEPDDLTIRIISVRRANAVEKQKYARSLS